jgi:acyl-CoA thioesterase
MEMINKMLSRDRFARLCGLKMVEAANGRSVVTMEIRDDHLNALDMVHGGAFFTLADYAFALAANSRDLPAVALSASMVFLRPGRAGRLTATAWEVSLAKKVGTYTVEIRDEAGELLATFQGLAYRKAGEKSAGPAPR